MKPRHAFSTLGCCELSLDEVIGIAERHGIDAVEIRGLSGELDVPTAFAQQAPGLPPWTRVRILALDTSFSLANSGEADRAALLRYVPWAERLSVPWLRVFDGRPTAGRDYTAELAETLRWWERIRSVNGWNVRLMIETHDGLLTAQALSRFLHQAPNAAILWDAHNTWRAGGELPFALWPVVRDHTVHIHVKDSIDRPSARHAFTYVLPGEGQFPIADLQRQLEQDGYAGWLSLEWERKWHPDLPPLEEALAAANRGWW